MRNMKLERFKDFDLSIFWKDSDYAKKFYTEEYPTNEIIKSIENELAYKLPSSYIELMRFQNGGVPKNDCFPTTESTSWAEDHIAITGIMGIGNNKSYSLCGDLGSRFMIDEWGYPKIGICVCDCPTAGHDMIMLDYTKNGEPKVVHVDRENNYKITFLAKDFETFIKGLVNKEIYFTSDQDLLDDLEKIKNGKFSSILTGFLKKEKSLNIEEILRNLLTELTNKKGYFALHADELSHLVYDIQFYLYSKNNTVKSQKNYLKNYEQMIAFSDSEISTGGYSENFITDWFVKRIDQKYITKKTSGNLMFTDDYENELFDKIRKFK